MTALGLALLLVAFGAIWWGVTGQNAIDELRATLLGKQKLK